MIEFNGNKSKVLISKLEIKSISGTLKICETLINSNNPFDFQSESSISITNSHPQILLQISNAWSLYSLLC